MYTSFCRLPLIFWEHLYVSFGGAEGSWTKTSTSRYIWEVRISVLRHAIGMDANKKCVLFLECNQLMVLIHSYRGMFKVEGAFTEMMFLYIALHIFFSKQNLRKWKSLSASYETTASFFGELNSLFNIVRRASCSIVVCRCSWRSCSRRSPWSMLTCLGLRSGQEHCMNQCRPVEWDGLLLPVERMRFLTFLLLTRRRKTRKGKSRERRRRAHLHGHLV